MKTRFVLHGGFTPHIKQQDDAFFREVLRSAPEEAKVLLVYFAKEADRINVNKEEDIKEFNKNKDKKTLLFEVATEELFLSQVAWADVVYLHGGATVKILEVLKKFPNLGKSFGGKVIAGDSAGANVLAKAFYSQRANGVFDGLGILPIRVICHYSEEHKNVFPNDDSSVETLLLREYEYKTFECEL